MGPGVVILCMLRGEALPSDHTYADIKTFTPQEFEWLFWKDKIDWLKNLYSTSTNEDPATYMFLCTQLDLLRYLYKEKKDSDTNTLVIVKVFKKGEVILLEEFFV